MIDFSKANGLYLVQGDVFEVYFQIENISKDQISKVYFSCNNQEIVRDLEYSEDEQAYCLRLTSEETDLLSTAQSSYDLTLEFVDGNRFTVVYENSFLVLPKKNKVEG